MGNSIYIRMRDLQLKTDPLENGSYVDYVLSISEYMCIFINENT
jgi:hypothetical protein